MGRWQAVQFVWEYYNIHTIQLRRFAYLIESEERHAILFGRSSYFFYDIPHQSAILQPSAGVSPDYLLTRLPPSTFYYNWWCCWLTGSEGISINQVSTSTFFFPLMTYLGLWIICRCTLWNIKTMIFHSPSSIFWVIFTHSRRSDWSSRFLCLPKSQIYKHHTMLSYDPSCQRLILWRICDVGHVC